MPQEVQKKIDFLCTVISEVEWSGILLYSTKGTIRQPKTFEITLEDIIPMDKGSKAYTEFEVRREYPDGKVDDKMIDYFQTYPDALDRNLKMGLIHSHNSMSVYFSGTDKDELEENCGNHNFYLSVIVNNHGDICGKVAMQITAKDSVSLTYKGLDENGEEFTFTKKDSNYERKEIVVFDCEFERPDLIEKLFDDEFMKNVKDITAERRTTGSASYANMGRPRYPQAFGGNFNKVEPNYITGIDPYERLYQENKKVFEQQEKETPFQEQLEEEQIYDEFIETIFSDEDVTGLVFSVEEALEVLYEIRRDPKEVWAFTKYTKDTLKRFAPALMEYYPDSEEDTVINLLDDIVGQLRENPKYRAVSQPLIEGFTNIKKHFIN